MAAFVAAVGIGAGEARAQAACAIPEDVPAAVYDEVFLDMLGEGFPMPEPACVRLTKTAVSACHKAVSAATRCWKGVGKALAKGAKTTCAEQGGAEQACIDFTAAELAGLQGNVEESAEEGHVFCDAGAPLFLNYCLVGVP